MWQWLEGGGSKGTFNKDGVDMGSNLIQDISGSLNSESYNQSAYGVMV